MQLWEKTRNKAAVRGGYLNAGIEKKKKEIYIFVTNQMFFFFGRGGGRAEGQIRAQTEDQAINLGEVLIQIIVKQRDSAQAPDLNSNPLMMSLSQVQWV